MLSLLLKKKYLEEVNPGQGDLAAEAVVFLLRAEFNPTCLRPPPPRPSNSRAIYQNQVLGPAGAEAKTGI